METTSKQTPANTENSESKAGKQNKADDFNIPTVTPDNDNGLPGPTDETDSSNKGKGPKGENL